MWLDCFCFLLRCFSFSKQRALRLRAYFGFCWRGISFRFCCVSLGRCLGCSFSHSFGYRLCNHRFSSLNGCCRGGCFSRFTGQAFGFTLTTTHFTRIVRRATVAANGDCWCSVGSCNFSHYGFGNWLGSSDHCGFFNNLCDRGWRLYSSGCCCSFAGFGGKYRRFVYFDSRAARSFYSNSFSDGFNNC